MSLVPVDPKNEASVVSLLEHAAQWLAEAVHRGEPGEIAAVKAQMATASEATKQLGLSKEIQHDAAEMVRRAEWTLRKATKKAQDAGEIRSRQQNLIPGGPTAGTPDIRSSSLPSASDFFTGKQEYEDANAMAELDPDQFDEVIDEARGQGNLSRTNVARLSREKAGTPARATPRRALPDQFFDAAYDLTKVTERIDRLVADDRFPQNAEKVGAKHRVDLLRAVELLTRALDRFPTN